MERRRAPNTSPREHWHSQVHVKAATCDQAAETPGWGCGQTDHLWGGIRASWTGTSGKEASVMQVLDGDDAKPHSSASSCWTVVQTSSWNPGELSSWNPPSAKSGTTFLSLHWSSLVSSQSHWMMHSRKRARDMLLSSNSKRFKLQMFLISFSFSWFYTESQVFYKQILLNMSRCNFRSSVFSWAASHSCSMFSSCTRRTCLLNLILPSVLVLITFWKVIFKNIFWL